MCWQPTPSGVRVLAPNAKQRALEVPQTPEPAAQAAQPAQCEANCAHRGFAHRRSTANLPLQRPSVAACCTSDKPRRSGAAVKRMLTTACVDALLPGRRGRGRGRGRKGRRTRVRGRARAVRNCGRSPTAGSCRLSAPFSRSVPCSWHEPRRSNRKGESMNRTRPPTRHSWRHPRCTTRRSGPAGRS